MFEEHQLTTDSIGVTSCSICGVSSGRYSTAYHNCLCPGTDVLSKRLVRKVVESRMQLYCAHTLPYNAEELAWQEIILGPVHDHLSIDAPHSRLDYRSVHVPDDWIAIYIPKHGPGAIIWTSKLVLAPGWEETTRDPTTINGVGVLIRRGR